MIRMSTSKAREEFADVLKLVARGERVLLRRHGKDVAAVVAVEDLALLLALEDRMDARLARAARKDVEENGSFTLEEVKRQLGL